MRYIHKGVVNRHLTSIYYETDHVKDIHDSLWWGHDVHFDHITDVIREVTSHFISVIVGHSRLELRYLVRYLSPAFRLKGDTFSLLFSLRYYLAKVK